LLGYINIPKSKIMESAGVKVPKDDQITNKDESVTNKDGNNNLEKGEQPNAENNKEQKDVKAVIPSNDNPELYETTDESSNKGQGPAGENL
jgi:hypothetical protein